jgi:ERF superfamily
MPSNNIYQGMAAAMTTVQAIRKDGRNTVQNFTFRGIDSVINAVGPALREQGIIVAPDVREFVYETITVGQKQSVMGHVRLIVAYTFWAQDGTNLTAVAAGEAMDAGDKATPKAMSVAYRTALLQALCIPTDDPEPDAETYEHGPAARPRAAAKSQPVPETPNPQPAADKGEKDPETEKARRAMWALAHEKFPDEGVFRTWIAKGLHLEEGVSLSTLTRAQMVETSGHLRDLATPDGPNIPAADAREMADIERAVRP